MARSCDANSNHIVVLLFLYAPGAVDGRNGVAIGASVLKEIEQIVARDDAGRDNFVQGGHGW